MKTWIIWAIWIVITCGLGGYFGYELLGKEEKDTFLIGEATYGHYQIEMACSSCHTDAFGGPEILQNACVNCHGQELEDAHDSHPKKKFTDPRDAYRIEIIDARYCVTCHTEHQEERTHPMGVTVPEDYCYHCHQEIGKERESHKGLGYETCASAGCHNYHDNRALYEKFLVENANQPWLKAIAQIQPANAAQLKSQEPIDASALDAPEIAAAHPAIADDWAMSSHAQAGVNCSGCHNDSGSAKWIEKPGLQQCQQCHKNEVAGFTSGKHGMRLSEKLAHPLPAMMPKDGKLHFREESLGVQHGCNACHSAHSFDTKYAAQEACLTCHADEHSLSFEASPHAQLMQAAENPTLGRENAVTCATCHMPRIVASQHGTNVDLGSSGDADKPTVYVEHNQNLYLRPNEKMIRPVCMQCHSLEFSIDALADENLIRNNFNGRPEQHIESIDWALKRE